MKVRIPARYLCPKKNSIKFRQKHTHSKHWIAETQLRTKGNRKTNASRSRRLRANPTSTHVVCWVGDGTGSATAGSGFDLAVKDVYLIAETS